jgi:DNA polymerase III subunit gamma/tau
MVFYLKYRPRKISDLDSGELREKLEEVLKGKLPDKIPHAFLFTGSKGLGKTSTARIIAKSINCTKRKEGEIEPCGKCSSCESIDKGSNLDVIEIDGASNRGIDEIRDLREKIRLAPSSSLKKIYIIDEVHMLTTEAFNALLKTLEEPPAHAVFVLCTTEAQKLPETITSRCFNIRFNRATDIDLVHSFKRIIKGEELKADDDALLQIAQMSDGSFRDGAKLLEEISNIATEIKADVIESRYNVQSINKSIENLISAFENKDAKEGIKIISELEQQGADFKLLNEKLINTLHQKLIKEAEERSPNLNQTKELIEFLIRSYNSIKYAILPQLPIELSIVEWSAKDSEAKTVEVVSVKESTITAKIEKKAIDSSPKSHGHDNILDELILRIKPENFSIAGVLRGCTVESLTNTDLVLSTGFKFHKERLSDKKVIDLIEKYSEELTGDKIKVSILLKE